jgi:hypothetical protein
MDVNKPTAFKLVTSIQTVVWIGEIPFLLRTICELQNYVVLFLVGAIGADC